MYENDINSESSNFTQLYSTLSRSSEVIDWDAENTKISTLVELFRVPESSGERFPPRRTDIDTAVRGEEFRDPDPLDYNIVVIGNRGSVSIDRYAVLRYLKDCRIVYVYSKAYRYDGRTYSEIGTDDITRLIYRAVEQYPQAPFVTRTMVNDILANLQSTSTVIDIPVPDGWDIDGMYDNDLIPFDNGLYSIEEDRLLPFTPYVFIRHRLAMCYNPKVQDHPVKEIYENIIPDEGTRKFFFEMVGYMLFSPTLSPPAIFVTYGPGQTGKSALQSTVAKACGEWNVSRLDITQISGTFTTAELQDKLINVCGETGSQRETQYNKIDGDLMKKLAEGDEITVQKKHKDAYKMRNTAKLWFLSNTLPDFGDLSSGMLRRVYVIPCRVAQSWDAQIYDRLQEYTALQWLINQAMNAYIGFLNKGRKFTVSDEMREELKAYRTQNGIMDYFESEFGSSEVEYIRSSLDGSIAADVYESYRNYIISAGGRAFSRRKFYENVRNEFRMRTERKRKEQQNGLPTNLLLFKKV